MMTFIPLAALARYCDGTASPADHSAVERWIGTDPDRRAALAALQSAWAADLARLRPHHVSAMVERLERDIAARRRVSRVRRARPGWASTKTPAGRAAAIAAITVLGTATWWAARHTPRTVDTGRRYATAAGQRATVDLRDGSRVILAPESHLDVPGAFGRASRELTLTGEAQFVVEPDARRPFRVRTAQGVTEDIGTTFVVSAYPAQHRTDVAVSEGAVAVGQPRIELRAGDLGQIDEHGRTMQMHGVDLAPYFAWTEGTLVFRGTPVREALPAIARWYDLDLRIGDSTLAGGHLVATFTATNPDDMLQTLAIALDASYARSGRSVTLYARHR